MVVDQHVQRRQEAIPGRWSHSIMEALLPCPDQPGTQDRLGLGITHLGDLWHGFW